MVTTPLPLSGSFIALQRIFNQINVEQTQSFTRLATGYRINRGSDDPAGLIAAENLRSALATLEAESRALERADSVIATADGALGEISSMLTDAQGLVVASANTAGMSPEEIQANQLELDSIQTAIDRVASSTTFNGDRLLDGTATFTVGTESITIGGMSTGDLGLTGIDLVNGDMEANQAAIDAAIDQVTTQRGELGAFSANTIRVTQNAVQTGIQYTTAAHSVIRDTDYASEISNMVRLEVLQKAALGAMAIAERARGSLLDSLLGR